MCFLCGLGLFTAQKWAFKSKYPRTDQVEAVLAFIALSQKLHHISTSVVAGPLKFKRQEPAPFTQKSINVTLSFKKKK